MHRVWVTDRLRAGETVTLEQEEARRVSRVLRLGPGDSLVLFDGAGMEGDGEVARCARGRVEVRVLRARVVHRESPLMVRLIQALPKGDRLEWVIQKATELGAVEIGVLLSRRCVVRWGGDVAPERRERWSKIAREAARQCGRTEIPELTGPWTVQDLCETVAGEGGLKLVLWEGEGDLRLGEALRGVADPPRAAWVVVGPEGGFEEEEVNAFSGAGFRAVRMGPRILRTESAGPAALAILQYLWGDLQ